MGETPKGKRSIQDVDERLSQQLRWVRWLLGVSLV
jgi:hypothetical protein